MNEDLIENGASARGPRSRLILGVALAATVVAGAVYAIARTGPASDATAAPTAEPWIPPTNLPVVSKPTADVPDAQLSEAINSIPGETGPARKSVLIVKGSSYLDGAAAIIEEDRSIGDHGRYRLHMICVGHGTVVVHPSDGSNKATGDGTRITCTAEPGAAVSAELTLASGVLRLLLEPDPDTFGAFAYGTSPL